MMKFNQGGENRDSIEQHIEEHLNLIAKLETEQRKTPDGKECLANRIYAIQCILQGRRTSLGELNDTDNSTVCCRTVFGILNEDRLDI